MVYETVSEIEQSMCSVSLLVLFFEQCEENPKCLVSDSFQIIPISRNFYLMNPVCKGRVLGLSLAMDPFVGGKEAIFFDTPQNDSVLLRLLNWVQSNSDLKLRAVIIGHSHDDCLGRLKVVMVATFLHLPMNSPKN